VSARAGTVDCLVRFGLHKSRENGFYGSVRPQFNGLQGTCYASGLDDVSHAGAPGIPDSGLCRLPPQPGLSIGFQFEVVRADAYLLDLDSELAWYRVAFEPWK
jgi:hypothetical protein